VGVGGMGRGCELDGGEGGDVVDGGEVGVARGMGWGKQAEMARSPCCCYIKKNLSYAERAYTHNPYVPISMHALTSDYYQVP